MKALKVSLLFLALAGTVACRSTPPPADPGEVIVRPVKSFPLVHIEVPEITTEAEIAAFPVVLDVRVEKRGMEITPDLIARLERRLLGAGIRIEDANASFLALIDAQVVNELEVGAGRTQVLGRGDLRLTALPGNSIAARLPLSVRSDANSTEAVATGQVLDGLADRIAAEIARAVGERARITRVKRLVVKSYAAEVDLGSVCKPVRDGLEAAHGIEVLHYEEGRAESDSGEKEARITLHLAPDWNGDLAQTLQNILNANQPKPTVTYKVERGN